MIAMMNRSRIPSLPISVRGDERGFTVIEMVVGVSLAAIAAAVVFGVFLSTQGAYYESRTLTENQAELRVVMGMLGSEIRAAGSDAAEIGVQRINFASPAILQVTSDLDADGWINTFDEPAEMVTYIYNATTEELTRATGAGWFVLLADVTSFAFEYLDEDGADIVPNPSLTQAQMDDVRAIRIVVTVENESDDVARNWSSVIALRNDPPTI